MHLVDDLYVESVLCLLFFSADLVLSTSLTSFPLVSPPPVSLSVCLPLSCLCGCDG